MKRLSTSCIILAVTIVSILTVPPRHAVAQHEFKNGDQGLMIMPTASTMPKGRSYFADYELLLLHYAYAPTSRTHLNIFLPFPVSTEVFEALSLGFKQNWLRERNIESSAWFTYIPKAQGMMVGNVVSVGGEKARFHGAVSAVGDFEIDEWEFVFMAGISVPFTEKTCGTLEYTNFSSFIEEEFSGLVTIGVQFRGETTSWEIGGLRPLDVDSDSSFLFFPVLKATVYFN